MSSEIPVRRREGGVPMWLLALIAVIAILAALYLLGFLGTSNSGGAGGDGGAQVTAAPTDPATSG